MPIRRTIVARASEHFRFLLGFARAEVRARTFAHMSDYLFHGEPPFNLLARSSKSVFCMNPHPKDSAPSCHGMNPLPSHRLSHHRACSSNTVQSCEPRIAWVFLPTDRRNGSGPARERKYPDHRSLVGSHDRQRPDTESVLSVQFLAVCTLKCTYVKPDPIFSYRR
jgi:hypothetical protein